MTILTVDRAELERKIGKVSSAVEEKITMMGTPIEEVGEGEVSVEVFPNRPDLLSLQGFSRAVLQYLGKKGVASFKIHKPEKDYSVKIDKSVRKVRPHTACAIVKGLRLDDAKIKELVEIQEKLHITIGRKRKKLAIGIYPLEKIKLPIRYMAKKPDEIKFLPLESAREMTGRQILRQHPKGRDYADLLKDAEVYPIFVDGDNKILSMPPIINSEETGKIGDKTREVFIECSGFNLAYLKKCLNIIVSAFSDMGGKIYAMNITGEDNFVSPDLSEERVEFDVDAVNKTLGLKLSEKEIRKNLNKMGVGYDNAGGKSFALVPAYRTDILHWVDLAEEVAIAYGYDNFEPEIPEISTIGEEDAGAGVKRVIGNTLAGLGLLETSGFHLGIKKDIKKMHYDFKEWIEVEDSKTENDVLRIDLLSGLLKIFSENSDSAFPQKIFGIGKVFALDEGSDSGVSEEERLAIALADEKVNFTDLKMILDYLFKMLDVNYSIEPVEDNNNYILGRVGKIIVDGKDIGFIGEIAPRVLKNWKIKVPVVGCEIDLEGLLV
jgi:phenylalanyl-tRNA synthetase beta chain